MNDERFEQQLRAAFTSRLQEVSPEREARLRAFSYRPRSRVWAGWSGWWSRMAAGAVAGAGAVAAALVLLLGSGAQSAFAGWTQVPTPPTAGALTAARGVCGLVPASSVLAAEARGPYTAIVYMHAGKPWQCVVEGRRRLMEAGTMYRPAVLAKPSAGQASLPLVNHQVLGAAVARLNRIYRESLELSRNGQLTYGQKTARSRALQEAAFHVDTGADSLTGVSGTVGRDVTGVTFVLRDGTHVQATVRNGWYLAWWPGSKRADATDPVAILVSTPAGTARAPYSPSFLRRFYHPCLVNERCVAPLLAVKLVAGVAPSLTRHFSLFRDTAPLTKPELRRLANDVPSLFGDGGLGALDQRTLGLDRSQARRVSFGARGAIFVTPGNGGVCVNVSYPAVHGHPGNGSGMGGCDSLAHTLRHGTFVFGSVYGSGAPSQVVLGLVPDGNRVVTFHFGSGRPRTVQVKQNVVFARFGVAPSSVTFTDAQGKPAHWPS